MMIPSRLQEVSINARGCVALTCPSCAISRTMSAARYCNLHIPITVECECGQLFDILIDTRRFYRHHLRLRGTCIPLKNVMPQQITVTTLSASGVSFHPMTASPLKLNDKVMLWFQLDNLCRTVVRLMAVVRWVRDEMVGAEFCERHAYEQYLDDYLRSASGQDNLHSHQGRASRHTKDLSFH